MPCYNPLVGIYKGEHTESGAKKFDIQGKIDIFEAKVFFPGSVQIPCGKCIGCKLDYSRQWADRMMLELASYNGKGIFVTLTYNNDNLPMVFDDDEPLAPTLDKRDLQLFMKKLRSRERFENRRLRFYAAGEYGAKTFRPHYHAIIFGLEIGDFEDVRKIGRNEIGQIYYTSKEFEDIWNKGFILLCDVSWNTCAYVSRYVTKKIVKDFDLEDKGIQKEFSVMSRRPGLGRLFLEANPDCLDKMEIPLCSSYGSVKVRLPKYFINTLKLTDPDRYDTIIKQRSKSALDRTLLELQRTDLSYLDYLEMCENKKLEQIRVLRRNKVM